MEARVYWKTIILRIFNIFAICAIVACISVAGRIDHASVKSVEIVTRPWNLRFTIDYYYYYLVIIIIIIINSNHLKTEEGAAD